MKVKSARVGSPIRVRFEDSDELVDGQIWAAGPRPDCGFVIAALEGGRYARVWTKTGLVDEVSSRGRALKTKGEVAA